MKYLVAGTSTETGNASDSSSIGYSSWPSKRARRAPTEYTSRFKGIVAQQNGTWGAQIYAHKKRTWLGTFKSVNEAAIAYDRAALCIRTWDSHRNFPMTPMTAKERDFQRQYSTEVILSMIRDGSYTYKFADFLELHYSSRELDARMNSSLVPWRGDHICTQLFEKVLTPSDVGKLNRLVIPKKHAVDHFPYVSDGIGRNGSGANNVELLFFDRSFNQWEFRYCYWKSSQSYVFTRGWNEFVREKEINRNDTVIFFKCEYVDATNSFRKFFMIDVAYSKDKVGEINLVENAVIPVNEVESEAVVQYCENELNGDEIQNDEENLADHDGAEIENEPVDEVEFEAVVQNPENELNGGEIEKEEENLVDKGAVEVESDDAVNKGLMLFGFQLN